jgi:hypothetical protein
MRHLQNPFKAFVAFIALIALMAFIGSCGKMHKEYKYKIEESSGRTSYTDSYTESNGCIVFTSACKNPTRVCGTFTIVTQK